MKRKLGLCKMFIQHFSKASSIGQRNETGTKSGIDIAEPAFMNSVGPEVCIAQMRTSMTEAILILTTLGNRGE